MPISVLIAGGGPAAIEAALRLHRLAGGRVTTTMLAPETEFAYRPLSVREPFAAGLAPGYPLARIAADGGFIHRQGTLASVDAAAHSVRTGDGESIGYDVLLVATGAVAVRPACGGIAFTGSAADKEALHGLIQDVEQGYTRRVSFVVPEGICWPLPLYELALMLAARAFEMGVAVDLRLITPEAAPLAMFGPDASSEVHALLQAAGIALQTKTGAERAGLEASRVVTLARLEGPAIPGLPSGFLSTDAHGRVQGVADVYAAGDVTAFELKQGGIACQQADAAAEHIAARAGASVEPQPFSPVLRGMLLTEHWARFLRREGDDAAVAGRALWWPPTKLAGRELAAYLEGLDEELGRVRGLPVQARVESGMDGVEVLSVH